MKATLLFVSSVCNEVVPFSPLQQSAMPLYIFRHPSRMDKTTFAPRPTCRGLFTLHQDDGNISYPLVICRIDQCLAGLLGIVLSAEDNPYYIFLFYHFGKSIGTEQDLVTIKYYSLHQRRSECALRPPEPW